MSDDGLRATPPLTEVACGCAYRLLRGYPLTYTSVRRCSDARLASLSPRLMAEHLGLRDREDEPERVVRRYPAEEGDA